MEKYFEVPALDETVRGCGRCGDLLSRGRIYLEGEIVPKDYEAAEKYLTEASEKGYRKADALLRYL